MGCARRLSHAGRERAARYLVRHFYQPLLPGVEVAVFTYTRTGEDVIAGAPLSAPA